MSDAKTVVICAAGIFVCYFYYGILQESLLRGSYGGNKERFTFVSSLLFLQCLVSVVVSRVALYVRREPVKDVIRGGRYPLLALAYLGAMQCSNMALRYINYPTQVVGKSCKPIPVMIIGVIFAGKRYTPRKYLFVLLIVLGVAAFTYKEEKASDLSLESWSMGTGEILLLVSLLLDGVTAAIQDLLKKQEPLSGYQLMFTMNFWSVMAAALLSISTGDLTDLIAFTGRNPDAWLNICLFCGCSALGQIFIYKSVADLSPLTCSIITTTRKCFTVVASVLLFGNSLSQRQYVAVAVVFTALFLDANFGRSAPPLATAKKNPVKTQ